MAISDKQKKILAFPYSNYDAIICDGAVRSGKTSIETWAFVKWAMESFDNQRFGICGKTVDSAQKNIIVPFISMTLAKEIYTLKWRRADKVLEVISKNGKRNYFEVFGGKDESSFMLIQGRTLAGVLLDEVALMPESFVNQALARCSVDGAKIWFSCNPGSPQHWFYKNWIMRRAERNALYLQFAMTDNPSLSKKTLERYKNMYSGVFYDRYIRGLWVVAEGLVYPMFNNVVPTVPRKYDTYYIGMDYGILNPTAMLLVGHCDGVWYVVKEFYHSGREMNQQKTDAEYYVDLKQLAGDLTIKRLIVDPSAASFITLVEKEHQFKIWDADNTVIEGIQHVAQCIADKKLMVNDCCKRTIQEFGLYRWDETAPEDKVIKENDHAMDALRYVIQTAGIWRKPTTQTVNWLI
mgnify:FL=1